MTTAATESVQPSHPVQRRTIRPVMRERSTAKIYDVQSKVYDHTFGKLVHKRLSKAIQQFDVKPGDFVLDLGVGTGNSLNLYPETGTVVGIDLSAGMLDKAANKITGRSNIALVQGNALQLPFGDSSFDHVFLSHVISVVSDAVAVIRETIRVAKPGARIVMLNHFQSTNKLVAKVEKIVSPICTKLGWRSDLSLQDLLDHTGVTVDYRYKLTSPDIWETVVFTNHK